MASITLKGNPISTVGELPAIGSPAPGFKLTNAGLEDVQLADFSGKTLVLNIVPSLDTGICAASTRRFNEEAASLPNTLVLTVSADLPFAQKRFCETEGLERVIPLSQLRDRSFGKDWGVEIATGPMAGLMSRAVVVVNGEGKVTYTEQVPEIVQEPDYDAALAAVKDA